MYQKPAVTEVGLESEASYCCQVISVGSDGAAIAGVKVTEGTVENLASGENLSALLATAGIYADVNTHGVESVLPEVVIQPALVETPSVTACI